MLTGENNNSIRVDKGSYETQCESRDRQGIGDEIRRHGRSMEIDALQGLERASLECAIKPVRQKGQGNGSRCRGFANVEFRQQPFGFVGDVVALRNQC